MKLKDSPQDIKKTGFQKKFFSDNPELEFPVCSCGCGKLVLLNYTDKDSVFRQYGSVNCSRKSKTISEDQLSKIGNKDWLYEQRITNKFSKETIGNLVGVSTMVVNKWLKIHDIPQVRYNESTHTVKEILSDSVRLESDYATGKTIETLAKEYGTSKATLSIFFAKHGITTRDSNTYDRQVSRVSKEEQSLKDWIASVYRGKILSNNRSLVGTEIDILIPEKNLGIEYNGVYSHLYRPLETSPSRIKGPEYHVGKTNLAISAGIDLLHIFSTQWKQRPEAVKTLLLSKLGLNEKIHARKCEIRTPSMLEKNAFLDAYHIQGKDRSKYYYGLYYNDELVAIMTFGTPRYNKTSAHELIRYCGKYGITVVGGFSKLLAHFRNHHTGSIISYADRCYSSGGVYKKNGFALISINPPRYRWVNINKEIMYHRSYFTKKRMLIMLGITKSDKSEIQIAKDLNLHLIFDCGTLAYVYGGNNGV